MTRLLRRARAAAAVAVAALVGSIGSGALSPAAAAGSGADDEPLAASGEPLRFTVEPLDGPVATLDGNVEMTTGGVTVQADVLFAFDAALLGRGAARSLATAAKELQARRPATLHVVGYTDAKGPAVYNLRLSRRRAEAVAGVLRRKLDPVPRIVVSGRGEAEPVAANTRNGRDDAAGRARNRRVELIPG